MDRKERGELLNQQVEEAFTALEEQLAEGHTQEFMELLKFYANFRSYSMGNLWLIKMQRPTATLCAGYRQWDKLGYQVKQGEQAIWIRAPWTRKHTDPDTGEITERLVGWIAVPVFAQDQLEGDPELPSPRHALEGAYSPLYDLTRIAIAGTGLMVDEEPLPQGVLGMSMGGRIVIASQLSDTEKCLVAWHEWAHELLHRDPDRETIGKTQRELEAESASFIMARMMGLENPFSRDYILNYRGTIEGLHASLTRIHNACKKMYGLLHVEEPQAAAIAA